MRPAPTSMPSSSWSSLWAGLVRDVPEVAELDLNPVVVSANGCSLVDVKLRLQRLGGDPDLHASCGHAPDSEVPSAPGPGSVEEHVGHRAPRAGIEAGAGDLLPADAQEDLRVRQAGEDVVIESGPGLGDFDHLAQRHD